VRAPPLSDELLAALHGVVGDAGLITDEQALAPYLVEQRGSYHGRTPLVIRPASTAETAAVLRILYEAGVPVVPQGGNTGHCGGAAPSEAGNEVILSLSRLTRIRALDRDDFTITVEAGCVLADIQRAAAAADRLFPLSLAAEGSCQIGGNLSTNAGGVQVLRYGNARELVLGLEVVLPDGRVLDLLRRLRKDNTGYDLKQLFCGAEGTLGVITAAVLKLFPLPRRSVTAMLTLPDADLRRAVTLLARARARTGDAVTAFEFLPRIALEFVLRHIPGTRDPFADPHPYYVLIEAVSTAEPRPGSDDGLSAALTELFADAQQEGLIRDAVVAQSAEQAAALWRLRESISPAQKPEGVSLKHDVSVPVSRIAEFVERASHAVVAAAPGARVVAFGHIGDGNVHFNISQPRAPGPRDAAARAAFTALREPLSRVVYDLVMEMGGSFSAEHGIGRLKRAELARYRSATELDVMRKLKAALDPKGLMNPGKVL